jgi:hypothetical protein
MNAVAACDDCNFKKGDWDPNTDLNRQPAVFIRGTELTYSVRLELIRRTRLFLTGKRRRCRARDETYMSECRAAANTAEYDLS